MFRVAVCDDEERERRELESMLRRWSEETSERTEVFDYSAPSELMDAVEGGEAFHLYLLDVLMPEMDGIALGLRLRRTDSVAPIVYLTTSPDFAVESYEVRAFHYLLKPVSEEKLFSVLDEALKLSRRTNHKKFVVRTRDGDVLLSPSDIYYVESSARFPHYVTKSGLVTGLMLTTSFKEEMTGLLAEPCFYLCGASFLINLAYVKSVEKDGILFLSGKRLTLPRSPLKGLRVAWTNYWLDS